MAILEHALNVTADYSAEKFRQMDAGELLAQQLVQRGAIDVLEHLQSRKELTPYGMAVLDGLKDQLMILHEVANARGVTLLSYGL